MKSLNNPSKMATVRYPVNTPRVSRKRIWFDRSEWRKSPESVLGASTSLIDTQMSNDRATLASEYDRTPDLMERTARQGIRRS
jgi:hypothetical protein